MAQRGHKFGENVTLPVVLEDDFETVAKTKDVVAAFEAIGLGDDLVRAHDGVHQRAGVGKLRGRRLRTPRSVLVVVADMESAGAKAARNLVGVEVTTPKDLNVERVAPGGDAGRLTVFTRKALAALEERVSK